jgi:aminotransferase in exopolysaccharide biosynthesis
MKQFIEATRDVFQSSEFIPLHAPRFRGNEKKYLQDTIDSTYVSSIGEYVNAVEKHLESYCDVAKAVAVSNGTSGLHAALRVCGVRAGNEVLTQALTFVATANSIAYNGASPVFIDVDLDTMGMSPVALGQFLDHHCERRENGVYNLSTGKRVAAVLPMHTFGFLNRIAEIQQICRLWGLPLVEDAAEALGTFNNNKSAGTFGDCGVFSFNGNKVITAGGGGMVVSNNVQIGSQLKHVTTTAKVAHPYEYHHDELGFNYRMPNLNAALLLAQLEQLDEILESKRRLFAEYRRIAQDLNLSLMEPPESTTSNWNHWLMALQFDSLEQRDECLMKTNAAGVMTRPIWSLMYKLPMYSDCMRDDQRNAQFLEERIVNIPSNAQ